MSSSRSPEQGSAAGLHHASTSSPEQDSGPLSTFNPGFVKNIADKRTTREGNTPKRRGPKPDSKPALTRRQELNRQAQRTHRERKELYVKALEDEVLRLKEVFSDMSQDRDRVSEENTQLKQALAQHGIPLSSVGIHDDSFGDPGTSQTITTSPSAHSQSHTSATGSSGVPYTPTSATQASSIASPTYAQSRAQSAYQGAAKGVDYDQIGIDFVLTLEKPCMSHIPLCLEMTAESGTRPRGHALMASCPPQPLDELSPDIPFGHANSGTRHVSDEPAMTDPMTWEPSKADLGTLLGLSQRLNLDGEITPVMAWGMVMAHPGFEQLGSDDFEKLAAILLPKVRCYGFGAVMEEYEARDILDAFFDGQAQTGIAY